MSVVEKVSLFQVPAYSMKQVSDLATVLLGRMEHHGFDKLPTEEQVALRLLRTLLDGFRDE